LSCVAGVALRSVHAHARCPLRGVPLLPRCTDVAEKSLWTRPAAVGPPPRILLYTARNGPSFACAGHKPTRGSDNIALSPHARGTWQAGCCVKAGQVGAPVFSSSSSSICAPLAQLVVPVPPQHVRRRSASWAGLSQANSVVLPSVSHPFHPSPSAGHPQHRCDVPRPMDSAVASQARLQRMGQSRAGVSTRRGRSQSDLPQ
jgi:hypothetical protein